MQPPKSRAGRFGFAARMSFLDSSRLMSFACKMDAGLDSDLLEAISALIAGRRPRIHDRLSHLG
jgi:hypothetical protein